MMPGELFSDGINTTLEKYLNITSQQKRTLVKKLKFNYSIDNILRISLKKLIIDPFGSSKWRVRLRLIM